MDRLVRRLVVPRNSSLATRGTGSVRRHRRSVLTFTPNPEGGYQRPQDIQADLTWHADGTFTLAYNSGEARNFDANGRATGHSREGAERRLRLRRFRPAAAHYPLRRTHLSLTFDGPGRLTAVESNDGRTVAYGYAEHGSLTLVTDPSRTSCIRPPLWSRTPCRWCRRHHPRVQRGHHRVPGLDALIPVLEGAAVVTALASQGIAKAAGDQDISYCDLVGDALGAIPGIGLCAAPGFPG